jgi:hypothetical protein
MQIKLEGLARYGLDGEYELDPQPNMHEFTRFRKAAGLTPSEMTDVITGGGLELLPLYVYTALWRAGKPAEAAMVFEVPFDMWGGADLLANGTDPAGQEDDAELPPETGSDEKPTRNAAA